MDSAESKLQSLDLGLAIIQAMNSRDRLTVRAAAALTSSSVGAAHRSLKTLESRGFVSLASGGRGYVPGPQLMGMAMTPGIHARTKFQLRPVLQSVREETGESVHTATLIGNQVLVLDGRRSKHPNDIGLRIGMTAPAHAMAAGKLLLSELDTHQVRSLFPSLVLPRRGPGTITKRESLEKQLQEIKKSRISFTFQESEAGINSFAIPIFGTNWRNRVALVVSVPVIRGSQKRIKELAMLTQAIIKNAGVDEKALPTW